MSHFGGDQIMQVHIKFEGVLLNNALVGLVIFNILTPAKARVMQDTS